MAVEFLSDTKPDYNGPCWSYQCTGEHEGPPIICYIYDPRLEDDEGLAVVEYRKMEWNIPPGVSWPKATNPPEIGDTAALEGLCDDYYWDVDIRDDVGDALMR